MNPNTKKETKTKAKETVWLGLENIFYRYNTEKTLTGENFTEHIYKLRGFLPFNLVYNIGISEQLTLA